VQSIGKGREKVFGQNLVHFLLVCHLIFSKLDPGKTGFPDTGLMEGLRGQKLMLKSNYDRSFKIIFSTLLYSNKLYCYILSIK
jgi:hypothetical protein